MTQQTNTVGTSTGARPDSPDPATVERPSFETIASGFHLGLHVQYAPWFVGVIESEIAKMRAAGSGVRALDVGCGIGLGRNGEWARLIASMADEVWGVEPDTSITPEPGAFSNFQHALLEDAELPPDHFDLVYSFQVIEHVNDPAPFMKAAYRALRPGGVHLFYTINGRHYFAKIASFIRAIKLDALVLKAIMGEEQFEHQYPVAYKLNTPKQIDRHATAAGFEPPEYAYLDRCGPKPYMRGPLVLPWWFLQKTRGIMKDPESLLGLIVRMRKPG